MATTRETAARMDEITPPQADPATTAALTPDATGGVNPKDLVGITKPRLSLVPPALMLYGAMGLQDGAVKYGPFNWRTKPVKASIYIEAKLRHLFAYYDGENDAHDSGWPHLAHDISGSAIMVDAAQVGCLIDDRPIKGGAAELIWKMTKFMEARARGEKVAFSTFPYEAYPV